MIDQASSPAQILEKLGITEPADLDIEAIAYACGAFITRERLSGCEANIIGTGDRAVITVNSTSIESRQRFSAGHELGHWMRDRGQNAFGCSNRTMQTEWTVNNPESRANRFAADLLLPLSMFVPLARAKPITFDTVAALSGEFKMSRTATALRLVEHGSSPAIVIYFENAEWKWFRRKASRSPSVSKTRRASFRADCNCPNASGPSVERVLRRCPGRPLVFSLILRAVLHSRKLFAHWNGCPTDAPLVGGRTAAHRYHRGRRATCREALRLAA